MPRRLRLGPLTIGLAVAAMAGACTSVPPEELSVPLFPPTTTTVAAESQPDAEADDAPEGEAEPVVPGLDVDGRIAVGGLDGLVITEADGTVLQTASPTGVGTQPAWSRDGSRAVAYIPDRAGGSVVVAADGQEFVTDARRSYFFFSWSGDGAYIAALGPGPQGTTLDILTPEGELATEDSIDTASFYLAWEPGGDDLVVHLDDELLLIRDPLALDDQESLGTPGQAFLAPVWIPETRDIVIVDEGEENRLIRLDVDDGTEQDLGPVGGAAGFTVSPDGTRLFLTHDGPDVERSDDIEISLRPVQETLAASEVVLLESGRRIGINDELTVWAEWAPDGSAVAMLQIGAESSDWRVFDENGVRDLGEMVSTPTFFRNYVFFSWQFVESPRIWAPDADAIVYAAIEDGEQGIFLHPLDGERVRVGNGDVAFFAPEPDGGAPSPA
ncbi:MAG: hypothetical protein AAGE98_12360 [Actinomycetota bacterium]